MTCGEAARRVFSSMYSTFNVSPSISVDAGSVRKCRCQEPLIQKGLPTIVALQPVKLTCPQRWHRLSLQDQVTTAPPSRSPVCVWLLSVLSWYFLWRLFYSLLCKPATMDGHIACVIPCTQGLGKMHANVQVVRNILLTANVVRFRETNAYLKNRLRTNAFEATFRVGH